MLINVKMQTIVGIITFMSMIIFVLSLSDVVFIMLKMLKCQQLLTFNMYENDKFRAQFLRCCVYHAYNVKMPKMLAF